MCDTFVYVPTKNTSGNIIFGKNSDREPNEAQAIVRIPAKTHKNKKLKCTYVEVPQVKETFEVLLSKPFNMWGAEMGANEHNLVIGNEAVFTKIKFKKNNSGLTGMDLLRLALERTKNADDAFYLITELIEKYGQNANGGYKNELYYHNSFIIADKQKAWVLETAGKHWVAEKVSGFRSISNRLTIGEKFDLSSKNIEDFARKKGWLKKGENFHFAKVFSDWFYTYFSKSAQRYAKTCSMGTAHKITSVINAQRILTSHYVDSKHFNPTKLYNGGSVCMHATDFTNPTQTVGSMIAEIRKNKPSTYWFTGTSNPCVSVYKAFFMGGKSLLPDNFKVPTAFYDDSFWWQAEKFHRKIMTNYTEAKKHFERERIAMQLNFFNREQRLMMKSAGIDKLDTLSYESIEMHTKAIKEWQQKIQQVKSAIKPYQLLVKNFYKKMNKEAHL
ncbi:MAG: C69 family dipeptidase [Bacteroidales bacterium]|nr:C69 family dipeptidase [Bacteroidales bacterium]